MGDETPVEPLPHEDIAAVERLKEAFAGLKGELGKVIVGQQAVLEELLIGDLRPRALPADRRAGPGQDADDPHAGRCAEPDLQPHPVHARPDALGHHRDRGDPGGQGDRRPRSSSSCAGPIFANIVLADEINRTPPKTQAALLEAMQERQVTIGGERHRLPDPFFVLATQNPIEQEGTYPLPEAQLDRFMFNILVDYPGEEEELDIVRLTTSTLRPMVAKVLSGADILELQEIVRKVPVAEHVMRYAVRLTRLTRRDQPDVPDFIRDYVSWGAGPRASQYLVLAAKARAVLDGRYYVSTDDIRAVAGPVLRHRIITNFNAEAEGLRPDDIVKRLVKATPTDEHEAEQSGKLPKIFKSANVG